jgi:hypothetical protein
MPAPVPPHTTGRPLGDKAPCTGVTRRSASKGRYRLGLCTIQPMMGNLGRSL